MIRPHSSEHSRPFTVRFKTSTGLFKLMSPHTAPCTCVQTTMSHLTFSVHSRLSSFPVTQVLLLPPPSFASPRPTVALYSRSPSLPSQDYSKISCLVNLQPNLCSFESIVLTAARVFFIIIQPSLSPLLTLLYCYLIALRHNPDFP